MRLVAHLPPAVVRPLRPLDGERLEQQIRDGLAVVGEHASVDVDLRGTPRLDRDFGDEQGRQVPPEVVSTPLLEFGEERRGPVRLTGRIVHLVRIVEERTQSRQGMSGEGAIEWREVAANGVTGEMVDDVALATGGGALDQLAVPSGKERVEPPPAGGSGPVEHSVGADTSGQIDDVARICEGHQHDEWQVARILHLLERQRLEVPVRRYRLGQVGDLERARVRSDHRLRRRTGPRGIARCALVDDVNLIAQRSNERRSAAAGRARPTARRRRGPRSCARCFAATYHRRPTVRRTASPCRWPCRRRGRAGPLHGACSRSTFIHASDKYGMKPSSVPRTP